MKGKRNVKENRKMKGKAGVAKVKKRITEEKRKMKKVFLKCSNLTCTNLQFLNFYITFGDVKKKSNFDILFQKLSQNFDRC